MKLLISCLWATLLLSFTVHAQTPDSIQWGAKTLVRNVALDSSGRYGSQYARMLPLKNGSWLMGYTISSGKRYDKDQPYGPASTGGLELEISMSTDKGRTWSVLSTITDPGRDLDNAQLIEARDGSILLSCRSVRWQESYILRVYISRDKGRRWEKWSVIDSTAGAPGALGHPDKGIYEPHFYYLADGRLAVQYANEKHVVENPSYSQIISEKISPDQGHTWGPEIWVAYEPGHPASRPGMPVWTRMKNGLYITVYEICGPEKCHVYYKTSPDGAEWPVGLGTPIPDELGGPFVLGLTDGRLVVTSNSNHFSISDDLGKTWRTESSPWQQMLWGALYQAPGKGRILSVNSARRPEGGTNIQLATGVMPHKGK
ncbi:MAG TPA: sialidase family protein [Puia sp.]|nr:sialidase family protein [Puia sp.]